MNLGYGCAVTRHPSGCCPQRRVPARCGRKKVERPNSESRPDVANPHLRNPAGCTAWSDHAHVQRKPLDRRAVPEGRRPRDLHDLRAHQRHERRRRFGRHIGRRRVRRLAVPEGTTIDAYESRNAQCTHIWRARGARMCTQMAARMEYVLRTWHARRTNASASWNAPSTARPHLSAGAPWAWQCPVHCAVRILALMYRAVRRVRVPAGQDPAQLVPRNGGGRSSLGWQRHGWPIKGRGRTTQPRPWWSGPSRRRDTCAPWAGGRELRSKCSRQSTRSCVYRSLAPHPS